ncbi:MAG: DUF7347 domain-containing protein [Candidatus Dojkabacteria bacterium]
MRTEQTIHKFQRSILEKLSTAQSLRFNDLLLDGLESEHMYYHLKKLIEMNFVEKRDEKYQLTDPGKGYVDSIDDETKLIEKTTQNYCIDLWSKKK